MTAPDRPNAEEVARQEMLGLLRRWLANYDRSVEEEFARLLAEGNGLPAGYSPLAEETRAILKREQKG